MPRKLLRLVRPLRKSRRRFLPAIRPPSSAKTEDDINIAQRNLDQTLGKQLSAAQLDLVEKIKSFAGQSNEASKTGDWARAQNLSQKAPLAFRRAELNLCKLLLQFPTQLKNGSSAGPSPSTPASLKFLLSLICAKVSM